MCAKYKIAELLGVEDRGFSTAAMRFRVVGLPYLTKELALCSGCCKDMQYTTFLKPWWDKVLAWKLDPRLIVPEYLTLPKEHRDLTFLFIQNLRHVFQKHLALTLTNEDGALQTTNRWGQTVFSMHAHGV